MEFARRSALCSTCLASVTRKVRNLTDTGFIGEWPKNMKLGLRRSRFQAANANCADGRHNVAAAPIRGGPQPLRSTELRIPKLLGILLASEVWLPGQPLRSYFAAR
jgi:hypothetical protein